MIFYLSYNESMSNIMTSVLRVVCLLFSFSLLVTADSDPQCVSWAEQGECTINPIYMLENCADACGMQAARDRDSADVIEMKIGHIKSFFELEAKDIDENVIKFDQFKGQVTVVTNVASHCGEIKIIDSKLKPVKIVSHPSSNEQGTDSHYKGLVELHNAVKEFTVPVNILAFPCNQFGEQEPDSCTTIKRFADSRGVEFTMMNKVDVNGINAHPVYLYMKKVAGPPRIVWNFGSYFVVATDGSVASFSGVQPMELLPAINQAIEFSGSGEL